MWAGEGKGIWKGLLEEVGLELSFKDERTSTKGGKRKSTLQGTWKDLKTQSRVPG